MKQSYLLSSENAKQYTSVKRIGRKPTHGYRCRNKKRTKEYLAWAAMWQRCCNSRAANYRYYGAKGVTVCSRWHGPDGFLNFLADVGKAPTKSHTLDRINPFGNYEPGNVRWASREVQSKNTRRNYLKHQIAA